MLKNHTFSINTFVLFNFLERIDTLVNYIEDPYNVSHLRLIVAGTAGTGKSFLIKCLVHSIRTLLKRNRAVQVLCPTKKSDGVGALLADERSLIGSTNLGWMEYHFAIVS